MTRFCFWFGLCLLLASPGFGQQISYFRQHSGVYQDRQPLPDDLGQKENLKWRVELASGHSTPCLTEDRIFVTTFHKEKQELATVALDRSTGKQLWKQVAPAEQIEPYHPVGSPASCTVACDGERVYSFFGSYGLLCYSTTGKLLWKKPLGPFQDEFGANSSPVLVDGKVILNEDHDVDSFLIAVSAETGETLWKTPREGFTRSYSTPVICQVDGRKQVVVAGSLRLVGYDLETGKRLWWVDGFSRILDTTPAVAGGLLYVASWTPGGDPGARISMEPFDKATQRYDKNNDGLVGKGELPEGAVLQRFFRIDLNQDGKLNAVEWKKHAEVFQRAENTARAIRPGGQGDVTRTRVAWTMQRGLPTVPSPLVYDGVMYMVKNGGVVTSVDAKTGKILKEGRSKGIGQYYASPVAGDGKVYLAAERGVVTVLKAGGEWEVLSSHDFDERIMATPVLADGRIYLRTEAALYCFGQ